MINVELAHEKSHFEHRSGKTPSVSPEEEEIQNSNFEHESSKHPSKAPGIDDRKPAAKRIKKEPEDEAQSWAQEEEIEKATPKPWETRRTMKQYSESIFLLENMVKRIMM